MIYVPIVVPASLFQQHTPRTREANSKLLETMKAKQKPRLRLVQIQGSCPGDVGADPGTHPGGLCPPLGRSFAITFG